MSIDDRINQMASCDNVVILSNVQAASHLSDGGRWIETELSGEISEIVKQSDRAMQPRDQIRFILDGGELRLRGTTIRAGRVPLWGRDMQSLVCLNRRNRVQGLIAQTVYEIHGGTLVAQRLAGDEPPDSNLLYDKPLYNVVTAIRDAAGVKVRQIWRSQQPIASLLVPGDVVVEIRVLEVREPSIDQPLFAELQTYQYTDDVLLVRELDRRPVLVSNGSWIRTRVRAVVERAYKTKNLGATAGATVEYDYDGGEMTIKGVLVKTMHAPVFRDRRQLVAFRLYDQPFGGGIYLQPIKLYGVSDEGTLQPWQFSSGVSSPASKLYGLKLEEIEDALRKSR